MSNPNTDIPRLVFCTLDDYTALMERCAMLDKELAQIRHEMEIDELNLKLAAVEAEKNEVWQKVFLLRNKLEEAGVESET